MMALCSSVGKKTSMNSTHGLRTSNNQSTKLSKETSCNLHGSLKTSRKQQKDKFEKCTKRTNSFFPYLNMKMSWLELGNLSCQAYSKPGQAIQYVNKGSSHHRLCLNAIPSRVLKRLRRLTSINPGDFKNKTPNSLHNLPIRRSHNEGKPPSSP